MQWPKERGRIEKQSSTKHYAENSRSSNTNPTENPGAPEM